MESCYYSVYYVGIPKNLVLTLVKEYLSSKTDELVPETEGQQAQKDVFFFFRVLFCGPTKCDPGLAWVFYLQIV